MNGNEIVVVVDLEAKVTRVFSDFILVGIEEGLDNPEGNGGDPDKLSIATITVIQADKDVSLLIIKTALDFLGTILGQWTDKFIGKKG